MMPTPNMNSLMSTLKTTLILLQKEEETKMKKMKVIFLMDKVEFNAINNDQITNETIIFYSLSRINKKIKIYYYIKKK